MLGCNYVLSTFLKPLAWLGDFREMYNISLKGTALSGDLSKIDAVTGSSSYKSEIWKVKMTFPLSIKKKSFTMKKIQAVIPPIISMSWYDFKFHGTLL